MMSGNHQYTYLPNIPTSSFSEVPRPTQSIQDLFKNQCYLFGSAIYKTLSGDGTPGDYDFACDNVSKIAYHLEHQRGCTITSFSSHPDGTRSFKFDCADVVKPLSVAEKKHITEKLADNPPVMQLIRDKDGFKRIHADGTICGYEVCKDDLINQIKNKQLPNRNGFDNPKHQKYFANWKADNEKVNNSKPTYSSSGWASY